VVEQRYLRLAKERKTLRKLVYGQLICSGIGGIFHGLNYLQKKVVGSWPCCLMVLVVGMLALLANNNSTLLKFHLILSLFTTIGIAYYGVIQQVLEFPYNGETLFELVLNTFGIGLVILASYHSNRLKSALLIPKKIK